MMIRLKACLDIRRLRGLLCTVQGCRQVHSNGSWRPVLKPPRLRFAVGLESADVIVRPRPTRSDVLSAASQQLRGALAASMNSLRESNAFNIPAATALIQECLAGNQIEEAAFVLQSSTEAGLVFPTDVYMNLLEEFSSHYLFNDACAVATQLVNAEASDIDPSYIALALSGSMNVGSLKLCTDLLTAIVQRRRSELFAAIGAVEVRHTDI